MRESLFRRTLGLDLGVSGRADRYRVLVRATAPGSTLSTRSEVVSERASVTQEVPLDKVDLSDTRFQMRVVTRVSDLKRSLEADGQDEPVELLGPAPYRIIDGFRRCQAAKELNWKTIRAEVREGLSEEQAFRMAFTTNFVRKSLTSLDKANAMRLALKMGIAKPELPKAFGLSGKQVQRYLEVGKLPTAVQAVIDDKFVTMAHALLLAKFEVGNLDEAAAEIKAQKLSAQNLRKSLEAKLGKKAMLGRPKSLYLIDHDVVRIRSTVLSLRASQEEREALASQLLDLVAVLQRGGSVAGLEKASTARRAKANRERTRGREANGFA